jgi:hypothetical protein
MEALSIYINHWLIESNKELLKAWESSNSFLKTTQKYIDLELEGNLCNYLNRISRDLLLGISYSTRNEIKRQYFWLMMQPFKYESDYCQMRYIGDLIMRECDALKSHMSINDYKRIRPYI